MRLIIKGLPQAAILAAASRGIALTDISIWDGRNTMATVSYPDDHDLIVRQWYCEMHYDDEFQDGTLLYHFEPRPEVSV